MTAPDQTAGSDIRGDHGSVAAEVVQRLDGTFREVVAGRRAARLWVEWSRRLGLQESDFQVLWTLRRAAPESLDQSTLAGRLVVSPAQVSMTVERLRAQGWIERSPHGGDRRRNLWQLTDDGRQVIARSLSELARWGAGPHGAAPQLAERVLGVATREEAA